MTRHTRHESHLFTVRLWPEMLDPDHAEWRGRVEYVGSGEVRYFREWRDLVEFLSAALGTPQTALGRAVDADLNPGAAVSETLTENLK